jgi:molecular chaperone DnaJ
MDYYKTLGISRDATEDEIKKAFHRLAHKHHPHKGGDEKKFKEINEAYQVLSNKEKKAQYDRYGRVFDGAGQEGFASQGGQGFDFNWMWGNQPQGDNEDEFEFDVGGLGDIFGEFFGFGKSQSKKEVRKGKDIQVDFEISLEDTLKEIKEKITLHKAIVCPRCGGKGAEPGTSVKECFTCRGAGEVQQMKRTIFGSITRPTVCPECNGEGQKPEKPCNVCKGEGRVKSKETIEIVIPAGVDNNQIVKISGQGEAGKKGGKAGDLYVRVLIRKHPIYSRKGDDLYVAYPINFSQAALGDEFELLTLEKTKLLVKIPAGSKSGKILRISGKGIPNYSGYGRGDLYVELEIYVPDRLTKKQKELLKKLKEEGI